MAKFTFLELHLDGASFSADRPFSSIVGSDDETETDGEAATDDDAGVAEDQPESPDWASDASEESAVPTKPLAILGVLLVLVGIAAIVRYLSGEEDTDVEIETPNDDGHRPVGVTVDE